MHKLKDIPIKYQLIIMIFAISLVSLWVASTAFVLYDRESYKGHMEKELTFLSRIISSQSAAALLREDARRMEFHLKLLGINPEIISACITTPDGVILARYSREVGDIACLSNQNFISRFENKHLDLLQPVMGEKAEKLGELHIRQDLDSLNKRFAVFSVVMMLIVIVASLVAIFLSSKIQAFISAPILSLINTVDRITNDKDYSLRAESNRGDEIGKLVDAFNAMLDTINVQNNALLEAKYGLEDEVDKRTSELSNINRELEAFTYSVSHDLRAPLRAIDGFSQALHEDYGASLDQSGKDYLQRIRGASEQMSTLIESLLYLSRVSRQEMNVQAVNLGELARQALKNLQAENPAHTVHFVCPETLLAYGDKALLSIVLENLVGNAWKYSAKVVSPQIEVGSTERDRELVYFVHDNGVGFDMKYADKLFGPFQRLHRGEDFEGLGIGLATAARIIYRHSGEIWAESMPGSGARFYFTLGQRNKS